MRKDGKDVGAAVADGALLTRFKGPFHAHFELQEERERKVGSYVSALSALASIIVRCNASRNPFGDPFGGLHLLRVLSLTCRMSI